MTLVLWSGGLDSTLALFEEARKADEPIRALSIEHYCVDAQAEQARARRRLLAEFKRRGHPVTAATVKITLSDPKFTVYPGGVAQAIIWMGTAISHLDEREDLLAGYIRSDDIFHYRPQLFHAFEYLRDLHAKDGNLQLPLEWKSKGDVIEKMKELELFDLCWWCETPTKGKPCGTCVPCETMVKAEALLANRRRRCRARKKK